MYGTVLVPTDGSDISFRAAEEAIDLTAPGGTIHVLAVLEELPLYRESGKGAKLPTKDGTEKRTVLDEATERIEALATDAEIDCETTMVEGVPYHKILAHANEIEADAIFMGKRGQGVSSNEMLGSTTEQVIKRSTATVVSVPDSQF